MLQFPTPPLTVGQRFQNWTWDGVKWAPTPMGETGPAMTVGPTAPTNPRDGDLWFNDTNHELRVWNAGTNTWDITTATPTGGFLPLTGGILSGGLVVADWCYISNTGVTVTRPFRASGTNAVIEGSLNVNGNTNFQGSNYLASATVATNVLAALGITYLVGYGYPVNPIGFVWNHPWPGLAGLFVDGSPVYGVQTNLSDERLKQDIAPSKFDCLAAVEKIPLYEFRWQEQATPNKPTPVEQRDDNLIPVGFVAQRLDEVNPSFVIKPNNGKETPWATEHNNMLATLVGAVQQLSKQVQELSARVEEKNGSD